MEHAAAELEDLRFIKDAVAQRHQKDGVPSIYLLWGVLTLVGYPLLDWRPEYEGLYWMIAGPLGGAASWYLSRRQGLRAGENNRGEGLKWLCHWACLLAAGGLLSMLVVHGQLSVSAIGPAILLLVSLGMALGAIHYRPHLAWSALILAAGYVATFYVDRYVWTLIGIAFFVSSVINYLLARRACGQD